jgi:rRNA maturation endonuclease Nob1
MKRFNPKKIRWMTELKSRCDHPDEYLVLHFDILDKPYHSCKKCGSDISTNDKQDRERKSLWE